MSYRKFLADQLFTGHSLHTNAGLVLISDPSGMILDIVPEQDAGDDILRLDGLLSPGFINAHCHLELSHMRGQIPEHTGLVDFVFNVVTQRHLPEAEIRDAIHRAENEMRENGIVGVGDICNTALTLAQKQKDNLAYYNFVEVSGWAPAVAAERYAKAAEQCALFRNESSGRAVLVPHAPYSVSDPLWTLLQQGFGRQTISMHNQETAFEDELFLSGTGGFSRMYEMMKLDTSFFQPTGKSSLASSISRFADAGKLLLVHNTFTGAQDLDLLAASGIEAFLCLCINANLYIENAVPPVELFRKYGNTMVVGTDSLASNHSLSILDELKSIAQHFPQVPMSEMLQWATLNGAKALQMDDVAGSFEKGKRPGIILLQQAPGKIETVTTVQRIL